jgi:hypothetical protein
MAPMLGAAALVPIIPADISRASNDEWKAFYSQSPRGGGL